MARASGTAAEAPDRAGGYGRGAAVLSLGIGTTGLVTYTYFALASHVLSEADYGRITLLWSATFVIVSVLYRPVEQLLSRTIADRDARGLPGAHHLRIAALIQLGLAAAFAVGALALRGPIRDGLFAGSAALYWILIVTVLAYAASYFGRGFLSGHHRFGLYGLLVLMEATTRCLFALAVAVGISSGQTAVALGMAAAPLVSLVVVPFGVRRRLRSGARAERATASLPEAPPREPEPDAPRTGAEPEFTLARGGSFAGGVLVVMLCEQTFLNAGPLLVKATGGAAGAALAGFTFNVLLIARAPLQLFQAIQASILPNLTRMRAAGEDDPFKRSVNVTLAAIAAFASVSALVLLAIGPALMDLLFGGDFEYGRGGLVLITVGMGLYLAAATLNQAILAHGRAGAAAVCWAATAAGFVTYLALARPDDRVLQVEASFTAAALVLTALLFALYRHSNRQNPSNG